MLRAVLSVLTLGLMTLDLARNALSLSVGGMAVWFHYGSHPSTRTKLKLLKARREVMVRCFQRGAWVWPVYAPVSSGKLRYRIEGLGWHWLQRVLWLIKTINSNLGLSLYVNKLCPTRLTTNFLVLLGWLLAVTTLPPCGPSSGCCTDGCSLFPLISRWRHHGGSRNLSCCPQP